MKVILYSSPRISATLVLNNHGEFVIMGAKYISLTNRSCEVLPWWLKFDNGRTTFSTRDAACFQLTSETTFEYSSIPNGAIQADPTFQTAQKSIL